MQLRVDFAFSISLSSCWMSCFFRRNWAFVSHFSSFEAHETFRATCLPIFDRKFCKLSSSRINCFMRSSCSYILCSCEELDSNALLRVFGFSGSTLSFGLSEPWSSRLFNVSAFSLSEEWAIVDGEIGRDSKDSLSITSFTALQSYHCQSHFNRMQ